MVVIIENKNQSIDLYKNDVYVKTYYPDFDLEKSKELLAIFNNCVDQNGSQIYKYWKHKGFYILPALQELLFWDFFVGIVVFRGIKLVIIPPAVSRPNDSGKTSNKSKSCTFSSFTPVKIAP